MMRFNAALARRVALILGLSFPTFCNALADGRAVLPPRWMVEAYLSDAVVKPSRDDIARAIIPGLGMVPAFLGGGSSYTWNPAAKNPNAVLSNGNLTLSSSVSSYSTAMAAQLLTSPFKVVPSGSITGGAMLIGVANALQALGAGNFIGEATRSMAYQSNGSAIYDSNVVATFIAYSAGDLIEVGIVGGNFVAHKNGVLVGSTPNLVTGTLYPAASILHEAGRSITLA